MKTLSFTLTALSLAQAVLCTPIINKRSTTSVPTKDPATTTGESTQTASTGTLALGTGTGAAGTRTLPIGTGTGTYTSPTPSGDVGTRTGSTTAASNTGSTSSVGGTAAATIPIKQEKGCLLANFKFGAGTESTMILDTNKTNIWVNPNGQNTVNSGKQIKQNTNVPSTLYSFLGNWSVISNLSVNIWQDMVTAGDLSIQHTYATVQYPIDGSAMLPYDGVFGLGHENDTFVEYVSDAPNFWKDLMESFDLKQSAFGIALGINGDGSLILGDVDMTRFKDVPASQEVIQGTDLDEGSEDVIYGQSQTSWVMQGTIVVGSPTAGDPPIEDQKLYIASASEYVLVSMARAISIFSILNYEYSITSEVDSNCVYCGGYVHAPVDCNDTPPDIGVVLGKETANYWNHVWYIDPAAGITTLPDGSCVLSVVGFDGILDHNSWYLGQAWLKGKYAVFSRTDTFSIGLLNE